MGNLAWVSCLPLDGSHRTGHLASHRRKAPTSTDLSQQCVVSSHHGPQASRRKDGTGGQWTIGKVEPVGYHISLFGQALVGLAGTK